MNGEGNLGGNIAGRGGGGDATSLSLYHAPDPDCGLSSLTYKQNKSGERFSCLSSYMSFYIFIIMISLAFRLKQQFTVHTIQFKKYKGTQSKHAGKKPYKTESITIK